MFDYDRTELASRFSQRRIEAPGITQVITRQDIRDFGYQTLAEALRALPGTFTTDDHLYTWLGIRGFQRPGDYNARVLLLVDGVRINDAMLEQAYLGNEFLLDLSQVERIEFTAGPGSSVYGSNAALGVINVVTVDPGHAGNGRVDAVAGGNGYRRLAVSHSGWTPGGSGWLLAAAGVRDDGLARLDWDRADKAFVKFTGAEWTLSGAFMQRSKASPYGPWDTVAGDERFRSTDEQWFINGAGRRPLAAGLAAHWRATVSRQAYLGAFPTVFDGAVVMNRDHLWGDRVSGELRFEDRRLPAHVWVYGLAAETARVHLNNINEPALPGLADMLQQRSCRQLGIFVQDEFSRGDWRFNLGGRFDRFSSFGNTFNPRLAVSYAAGGGHYLKAMAGTAYRAPSPYEMYYRNSMISYLENPALKPEKVRTVELAWEHEGLHGTASASLFRHELRQLIEPPGAGASANATTQYENTRAAAIAGVVVAAERWLGAWRLRGSLSWQQVRHDDGETLANAPAWIAKLAASIPWLQGTLSGEWLGLAGRRTLTDGSGADFGRSAAYGRLDLAWRRHFGSGHEIFIGLQNAFDRRHSDPVGWEYVQNSGDPAHGNQALGLLPQSGRLWRLGVSLAY